MVKPRKYIKIISVTEHHTMCTHVPLVHLFIHTMYTMCTYLHTHLIAARSSAAWRADTQSSGCVANSELTPWSALCDCERISDSAIYYQQRIGRLMQKYTKDIYSS